MDYFKTDFRPLFKALEPVLRPVSFCLKMLVGPWPVIFETVTHLTPRVEGAPPFTNIENSNEFAYFKIDFRHLFEALEPVLRPVRFCLKRLVGPWPVTFETLIFETPRVEGVPPFTNIENSNEFGYFRINFKPLFEALEPVLRPVSFRLKMLVGPWPVIFETVTHLNAKDGRRYTLLKHRKFYLKSMILELILGPRL